jgi:FAD-dependent urate hydroxylase
VGWPAEAGSLLASPARRAEVAAGTGSSRFALACAPGVVCQLPAVTRLYLAKPILGPSGSWFLRDRFKDVNTVLGSSNQHVAQVDGGLQLAYSSLTGPQSNLHVDHVIVATSYVVDVKRLSVLHPDILRVLRRVTGSPARELSHSFESSVRISTCAD